jgi:hypothetical protein
MGYSLVEASYGAESGLIRKLRLARSALTPGTFSPKCFLFEIWPPEVPKISDFSTFRTWSTESPAVRVTEHLATNGQRF